MFRGISNRGTVSDERLSDRGVDRVVRRAAKRAGLQEMDFSAHSLRAGFVTQAAKDRKPIDLISQQTGHRSLPSLMAYVRRGVELAEDSPTAGLL